MKPNHHLYNFEVDFFDKSKNAVIEIDGPDHVGPRMAKDKMRDDLLKFLYKKRTGEDLKIYRIDARSYKDLWKPDLESVVDSVYAV